MLRIRIQREYAIVHTAWGSNRTVLDLQSREQSIGIDKIKIVAARHVRRFLCEQRRHVGVLAVEVSDIGDELTLLQEIAATGEIAYPGRGLLRPGFITRKPLPEGPQREARRLVDERLMDGGVNDETIEAHGQFLIGGWLEILR